MKTLGILCLAGLLWPLTAGARLGESRAQVETRYGKPLGESSAIVASYTTNGMQILVGYDKGASVEEVYTRGDRDFEKVEFQRLLAVNDGSSGWREEPGLGEGSYWRTNDTAYANWRGKQIILRLNLCPQAVNDAVRKRVEALAVAEKTRDVQGF